MYSQMNISLQSDIIVAKCEIHDDNHIISEYSTRILYFYAHILIMCVLVKWVIVLVCYLLAPFTQGT